MVRYTTSYIVDLDRAIATRVITKHVTKHITTKIITYLTRITSRIYTYATRLITNYYLEGKLYTTIEKPTKLLLGVTTLVITKVGPIVTKVEERET